MCLMRHTCNMNSLIWEENSLIWEEGTGRIERVRLRSPSVGG